MKKELTINRREFLKIAAAAGGGLVLAVYLPGCRKSPESIPTETQQSQPDVDPDVLFEPNLYLCIDSSDHVIITIHRVELGQGAHTSLAMIVAEELDADWSKVSVVQADADPAYGEQQTSGSSAVSESYTLLRRAGAHARHLLMMAAAQRWEVETDDCRTENGVVFHDETGRSAVYGDLAEEASALVPPSALITKLKDREDFRIIGTRIGRIDNAQLVDGKATFGLDIRLPNMLYAVLARSPVYGGKVVRYDDSKTIEVNGVQQVVQI